MEQNNHQELYQDIENLEQLKDDVYTKAMAVVLSISECGLDDRLVSQCKAITAEWDAYRFQLEQTFIS